MLSFLNRDGTFKELKTEFEHMPWIQCNCSLAIEFLSIFPLTSLICSISDVETSKCWGVHMTLILCGYARPLECIK